jgi:hypothetical protein
MCNDNGGDICDGNGQCVSSCMDGQQDGSETDTDCGGPICPKCSSNKKCLVDSDCQSNVCVPATHTCM